MSNYLTKLAVISLLMTTQPLQAIDEQCLQAPARTKACPNLVYRSVKDRASSKNKLFCFCKTDFVRIFNDRASPTEKAFNNMEWRQILAETGYTDSELKTLISP